MAEDRGAGISTGRGGSRADDLPRLLARRGVRWVDKEGWARMDACETAAGEAQGRPRVKFCRVPEMLEAAGVPGSHD